MENIPLHSLLAKLSPEQVAGVLALSGYAGPGSRPDTIRLYPRLDDLSGSFEIVTKDIIHFENAPQSLLPFGGISIWLCKDAQVVSTSVKPGTNVVGKDKEFDEVNSGRLRIRVRRQSNGADVRPDCTSRCECQSVCCVSRCA